MSTVAHQDSASSGSTEAGPALSSDAGVIQCAEHNPQLALVPDTLSSPKPARVHAPEMVVIPAIYPNDTPKLLFFQSSWAHRNARAKRLHGRLPRLVWVFLTFLFMVVAVAYVFLTWLVFESILKSLKMVCACDNCCGYGTRRPHYVCDTAFRQTSISFYSKGSVEMQYAKRPICLILLHLRHL